MNKMKYTLLTELNNRLQADILESFLEANGIDVELFQESVGVNAFPVTIDMLGRVQVFVPNDAVEQAKALLDQFEKEWE